eukprot:1158608-Pelagomonas_calceolata.AAC.2
MQEQQQQQQRQQCMMHLASLPSSEEPELPNVCQSEAGIPGPFEAARQSHGRSEASAAVRASEELSEGGMAGSNGWPTHSHVLQLMVGGLLASGLLVGGSPPLAACAHSRLPVAHHAQDSKIAHAHPAFIELGHACRWGIGRVAAARAAAAEAPADGLRTSEGPAGPPSAASQQGIPAPQTTSSAGGTGNTFSGSSSSSSSSSVTQSKDGGVLAALESGGGPSARVDTLDDPFAALRYAFSGWVPAWRQETQSHASGVQQQQQQQQGQWDGVGQERVDGGVGEQAGSSSQGAGEEGTSRRQVSGRDASSSSSSSSSNGGGDGAVTFQALPAGWWRDLPRVHYANFGARLGILPRLTPTSTTPSLSNTLDEDRTGMRGDEGGGNTAQSSRNGSSSSSSSSNGAGGGGVVNGPIVSLTSGALRQGVIVAFEDAVDAEYVANSLRVGMARRAGT